MFRVPNFSSQVFLKEHGRGLYSSYTNYTVHTQPLYIMACINGILFAVPSWGMMDVNTDTGKHSFRFCLCLCLCFTDRLKYNFFRP